MTFGAGRWGTEEDGARAILDAYAEARGVQRNVFGGTNVAPWPGVGR